MQNEISMNILDFFKLIKKHILIVLIVVLVAVTMGDLIYYYKNKNNGDKVTTYTSILISKDESLNTNLKDKETNKELYSSFLALSKTNKVLDETKNLSMYKGTLSELDKLININFLGTSYLMSISVNGKTKEETENILKAYITSLEKEIKNHFKGYSIIFTDNYTTNVVKAKIDIARNSIILLVISLFLSILIIMGKLFNSKKINEIITLKKISNKPIICDLKNNNKNIQKQFQSIRTFIQFHPKASDIKVVCFSGIESKSAMDTVEKIWLEFDNIQKKVLILNCTKLNINKPKNVITIYEKNKDTVDAISKSSFIETINSNKAEYDYIFILSEEISGVVSQILYTQSDLTILSVNNKSTRIKSIQETEKILKILMKEHIAYILN